MPATYRIRINNHLETFRALWFDGMAFINLENGEAELTGPFDDQMSLHRVLEKIRDLNMTLLSVEQIESQTEPVEKWWGIESFSSAAVYEIRVKSSSGIDWMHRLEDVEIIPVGTDEYICRGFYVDQPALHGLLSRVQVANLVLIAIRRLPKNIP